MALRRCYWILRPNNGSSAMHARTLKMTVEDEGAQKIMSSKIGLDGTAELECFCLAPFVPGENAPRGVVEQGKARMTTDHTAKAVRGDTEQDHSVNANIDWEHPVAAHELRLPSPLHFAEVIATLKTAPLPVQAGKMDWKGFYRQLKMAVRDWWYMLVCLHEDGYCVDEAVPFGIGNGPIFGNEVNDVVIAFIKDEFMDRIKEKDVECEVAFMDGTMSEEQREWKKNREAVHLWQQERATVMRRKYPKESDDWVKEQASHH